MYGKERKIIVLTIELTKKSLDLLQALEAKLVESERNYQELQQQYHELSARHEDFLRRCEKILKR